MKIFNSVAKPSTRAARFSLVSGPTKASLETFDDLRKRWDRIEADLQMQSAFGTIDYSKDCKKGEGWLESNFESDCKPQRKTLCLDSLPEIDRITLRGNITTQHSAWVAFANRWNKGDQDTTQLSAQVAMLNAAETMLREHGACIEGRPKNAPDVTESTDALRAAKNVDETVKEAEKTAKDVAKEAGEGLGKNIVTEAVSEFAKNVPWWVYAAGAGAVAIWAAAPLLTRKVFW